MTTERCMVCGEQLADGVKAKRVAKGKISNGQFVENKQTGLAHDECFDGAVTSPKLVLEKIRKLARSAR